MSEPDRSPIKTLVIVVVALAIAIPSFVAWAVLIRPQTRVAAGREVRVAIPDGAATSTIARILAGRGVIRNAAMFRLRTRLDGGDDDLKRGVYSLTTGMSVRAAEKVLIAGPPQELISVTIPEGFTIERIAERLSQQVGISEKDFIKTASTRASDFAGSHSYLRDISTGSLEGYLFPKTYRLARECSVNEAIEAMLDQFDAEIAHVDMSEVRKQGLSVGDVVTIASMIEREAKVTRDRALISSVIHNRLNRGMKLEIDATIEYVLKVNRPRLLNSDIAIESPYNTYRHTGLPPGPIASPGSASLDAAAHPAETAYLYYVLTDTDGSHTFTRTHAEFLKAKALSRKVVR